MTFTDFLDLAKFISCFVLLVFYVKQRRKQKAARIAKNISDDEDFLAKAGGVEKLERQARNAKLFANLYFLLILCTGFFGIYNSASPWKSLKVYLVTVIILAPFGIYLHLSARRALRVSALAREAGSK